MQPPSDPIPRGISVTTDSPISTEVSCDSSRSGERPRSRETDGDMQRIMHGFEHILKALLAQGNSAAAHSSPQAKEESLNGNEPVPATNVLKKASGSTGNWEEDAGAKAYEDFYERVMELDTVLRSLISAAQQLGSSVGVLSSAHNLCVRMTHISYLFRNNVDALFPAAQIVRQPTGPMRRPDFVVRKSYHRRREPFHPVVTDVDLKHNDFPKHLKLLAQDCIEFLGFLNEFPEFVDEHMNDAMSPLIGDLQYWASFLDEHKVPLTDSTVRRFIHQISSEMCEHIADIIHALSVFNEVGIPTIMAAQRHANQILLNISTVSTIFSAITATTLQFSYANTGQHLDDAVNACWFISLVFSIGAALNSWVAVSWKQAMYRSPRHQLPWWVRTWINQGALAFLVFSVGCFSLGLVLFTYSSHQATITCILTTAFSAWSILGLLSVSAWFGLEWWIFARHRGTKWLADVLSEQLERLLSLFRTRQAFLTALAWGRRISRVVGDRCPRIDVLALRFWALLTCSGPNSQQTFADVEMIYPPVVEPEGNPTTIPSSSPTRSTFPGIVRMVVALNRRGTVVPMTRVYNPKPLLIFTEPANDHSRKIEELASALRSSVDETILTVHGGPVAPVKALEFSPNGKSLVVIKSDMKATLIGFSQDPSISPSMKHFSDQYNFLGPMAWSRDGSYFYAELKGYHALATVQKDWKIKQYPGLNKAVEAVLWLPDSESRRDPAFLTIEGSTVIERNLRLRETNTYSFPRMSLHGAAITEDGLWLVCAGTLKETLDALVASSPRRAAKQIILFSISERRVVARAPVLQEVRSVRISKDNTSVLVRYAGKSPPELWKITQSPEDEELHKFEYVRTFAPRGDVDSTGWSCCFGGEQDELVLCAAKPGDIYVWDRSIGTLLFSIPASEGRTDMKCIRWCPGGGNYMFATGSKDGRVTLWKRRQLPTSNVASSGAAATSPDAHIMTETTLSNRIPESTPNAAPASGPSTLETNSAILSSANQTGKTAVLKVKTAEIQRGPYSS